MKWRYLAYRATTQAPLDLDVPIAVEELGWALSGAGPLRGTVAPDVGNLRASDGRLLLEEWGTLIYAEADGEIRWGGILISSSFEGEAWRIEAAEFSTYPNGIAYVGDYSKVGIDPTQVIADIWAHIQAQPDGNLGVVVKRDPTPIRLGKAAVPAVAQVFLKGQWLNRSAVDASDIDPAASIALSAGVTATSTTLPLVGIGTLATATYPISVKVGAETITATGRSGNSLTGLTRGASGSKAASHGKGTLVKYAGTPTRTIAAVAAEPYTLSWWEAPDCGSEIDTLAREHGLDLVESHRWNGEAITHEIAVRYPRAGRRRDDLAFRQGDNVIELVTPTQDGDDFANYVLGLGAGEGKKTVLRTTAVRDGRLRRTAVYTRKNVGTTSRMDALIRDELNRRRNLLEISSITVRNHPNAVIGSWALGDDVLVEASVPWLGDVELWCRVVAWSLLSEDTARLSLVRSDKFAYGG